MPPSSRPSSISASSALKPPPPRNPSRNSYHGPSSSSRPSLTRRTSIVYGKSSQPRPDPRPLNEKPFQTASMRRLVEFLTSHGYSLPISPKLLPSGKDIHNMIEFLFSMFDPCYRLTRLEDDVPAFFRMMAYPSQISKSALYAAGSPHSWPNLLAALVWLVDLLNFLDKEAEDGVPVDESTARYLTCSYDYFLQGNDAACEELDENVRQQLYQEIQEDLSRREEYARQITEVETKLQSLRSEQPPLVVLETRKSMLLADVAKFSALVQSLISRKTTLEKKLEQQKLQLEAKNAEVTTITGENQELANRIAAQTVNVDEFEKMTREAQRVMDELQSLSATRKEMEKETWDMEVLASRKLKELEKTVVDDNETARRLKLWNPETGNPFELHLNPRGETAEEVLGVDIKQTIRPQLAASLEAQEKNAREIWKESTDLLKQIHVKEAALQEKQRASAQRDSKIKKLEATHKRVKTKLEASLSATAAESEAFQTRVEEEEEQLKVLEVEAAEQFERSKRDLEQLTGKCQQSIQEEESKLLAVTEAVMSVTELVQSGNATLKRELDQLEELMSNKFIRTQNEF